MRFFYALALGLIAVSGISQSTFQKLVIDDNQTSIFDGTPTSDGGYIVCGTSGAGDNLLIKYSSGMQVQWSTHLGTAGSSETSYRIGEIPAGGYYVLGTAGSDTSIYLMNVNATGNPIWCKSFSDSSAVFRYPSVRRLNSGGFIISATEYKGGGDEYYMIIKTDAGGNLIWSRKYADYQGVKLECYDIEESEDGSSYLVVGDGNDSGLLSFCLDINGNLLWTKKYNDINNYYQPGFSICRSGDGGFIISGQNISQPILMKINTAGNVQWCKLYSYQANFQYSSVRRTGDGGYILSAYDSNLQFPYLIKTSGSGNFQWGKTYNFASLYVTQAYIGAKQCLDNGYFMALTGYTVNNGNTEGWLIKTNASGNTGCFENSCIFTDSSMVLNVTVASYSNTGIFTQTVSLNRNDISVQSSDGCANIETGVENKGAAEPLKIFPNPSTGEFFIKNEGTPISKVEIFNLHGEKVYELDTKYLSGKITVRITSLPPGLYILKTINEEGTGEHIVISRL